MLHKTISFFYIEESGDPCSVTAGMNQIKIIGMKRRIEN